MSQRASIPVVRVPDVHLQRFAQAVKENLDGLTGQHKNAAPLNKLSPNASMTEVITALNIIIDRLGG